MQQPEEDYKEEDHPILLLLKSKNKDIKTKLTELQGLCKNKEGNVGAYIIYNQDPNNLNYNNILHYLINRLNGWDQNFKKEDIIKFIDIILGCHVAEVELAANDKTPQKELKDKEPKELGVVHTKLRATLLAQTNSQGQSVLAKSIESANAYLTDQLLKFGADLNFVLINKTQTEKGVVEHRMSLLELAIKSRNNEIIISLINKKGDQITQDDIKLLLKYILSDVDEKSLIMREINQRKIDLLSKLLHDYKKPEEPNDFVQLCNRFLLYYTSKELKSFKATTNLDAKDLINEFIAKHKIDAEKLITLIKSSNPNVIQIIGLLEQEIWLNYQGLKDTNDTALHLAVKKQLTSIIEKLLQKGANPNMKNYSNFTPLHLAVVRGNTTIVEKLLQKGAEPNAVNGFGCTALYIAVKDDKRVIVDQLLQKGADPNIPCLCNTVLHLAVVNNDMVIVEKLLAKGAKIDIENINGKTPLDIAKEINNPDIINMMTPSTQLINYTSRGALEESKTRIY